MYIIIIGCGRVGSQLANSLSMEGHNIVIIDKNERSFKRLGANFNGTTLVGNGYDEELLREAGIEKADAVAVVTNGDNTNVVSTQVARKIFHVPTVVTRIYDPKREYLYRELGLDVIGGTTLIAEMIKEKITKGHFTHQLSKVSEVKIIEFKIDKNMAGLTLTEIESEKQAKIFAVIRDKEIFSVQKDMIVKGEDILLIITKK
ncbi:MAG: TrkA family potassium uptake protein [bacterium]